MGRTRTKSKKPLLSVDKAPTVTSTKSEPSITSLLEKVQALIVQCNYELALKFAKRIVDREPKHAEAREMFGVCLLEMGELDGATEVFSTLVPPHPNAPTPPPSSAYLYLAQLSVDDPWEALRLYEAAIDVLHSQLKGKDRAVAPIDAKSDEEDERNIKNGIVRALVGMVEIWMDPAYELCDLPQAEQTCEDLLQKAQKVDPGNTEALQALASVRMSQSRADDAKACLEQAWSTWKHLELDDLHLPPQDTRISFVRLCLELELFTPALLVLQGIIAGDDQDVEAWYLEGWCFFLMAEQAREGGGMPVDAQELTWEELAKDARDCLDTCQTLHENQEHPDRPLLVHAKELTDQLEKLGIHSSPVEDDEEDDGGQEEYWEDDSDDDDQMVS